MSDIKLIQEMITPKFIRFKAFFRAHGISLLIVLVINALVLTNSILHHPKIGYDVGNHLNNIQILPYRFPLPGESSEYFSAPLPYLIPSLFDKICVANQWNDCRALDGRSAQIINFFLSIGITILLWKLAGLLRPGSEPFRIALLSMLAVLTVYYKTFSQARGEPYVAFFTALTLYLLASLLFNLKNAGWRSAIGLGITLGLLILSRQWSLLLFPAVGVLLLMVLFKDWRLGWRLAKIYTLAGLVAFIVGGWFYLYLYFSYGSFTAFNSTSRGFAFSNQPFEFYRNLAIKDGELFDRPVRDQSNIFGNQFFPVFYSETWGDYFCFFTCVGPNNVGLVPNREEIAPYLGRVNRASLYPTLLLFAAMLWGAAQIWTAIRAKKYTPLSIYNTFLFFGVLTSMLGFLWFLISYPNSTAIKATYMIQIFILLPVLAAGFLERLWIIRPWVYRVALLLLWLVIFHNLPAMITRFNWFLKDQVR